MRDLEAVLLIEKHMTQKQNPRDGKKTTLALWVRNLFLGDNINGKSPRDFILSKLNIVDNETPVRELEKKLSDKYYYLPVYGTSHAGIAFDTVPYHDKWDSGRAGLILISKKQAPKAGITRDNYEEVLRDEVREYSDFVETSLDTSSYCSFTIYFDGKQVKSQLIPGFFDRNMLDTMKEMCPTNFKKLFDEVKITDSNDDIVVRRKIKFLNRRCLKDDKSRQERGHTKRS